MTSFVDTTPCGNCGHPRRNHEASGCSVCQELRDARCVTWVPLEAPEKAPVRTRFSPLAVGSRYTCVEESSIPTEWGIEVTAVSVLGVVTVKLTLDDEEPPRPENLAIADALALVANRTWVPA